MTFVEMRSVRKIYPDGTEALKSVDLEIDRGEILGLLGENGAGKTTLMKILSGLLQPSEGDILIDGKKRRFRDPGDALKAGIGMVHQHFSLVPTFDALQNIVLGCEGSKNRIDRKTIENKLRELMDWANLKVPLDTQVELLPVGAQQKVEILKSLYRNVDLLILDEPTSILGPLEVDELIRNIKGLREQGKTIVLITHKLREIIETTDRITVLRSGLISGHAVTEGTTPEILAKMMVGEKEIPRVVKEKKEEKEILVRVSGLKVRNDMGVMAVKGESFYVGRGEIFGIAGVEGNGQKELVEAVTGLRRADEGRIEINGIDVTNKKARELYAKGIAHIPEDRGLGLILEFSLSENLMLGRHRDRYFMNNARLYDWKKIDGNAADLASKFSIVTSDVKGPVKSLSGGNQQKAIVAREASRNPLFIIAVQPTKGLDVGATQFIRELLVRMSNEGRAVLLVSMDLDEITELSDRMAVMYEGRFVGVARPEELNREQIGMMMGGVHNA